MWTDATGTRLVCGHLGGRPMGRTASGAYIDDCGVYLDGRLVTFVTALYRGEGGQGWVVRCESRGPYELVAGAVDVVFGVTPMQTLKETLKIVAETKQSR